MYAKHKSTEKFGYKVKNVNKIENDSGAFPRLFHLKMLGIFKVHD